MASGEWVRVKALFGRALELPPEARAEFLLAEGVEEPARREVEALLAAHAAAEGGFVERPLASVEDTVYQAMAAVWAVGGRVGRFRLVRCLAEGGMGVVYVAEPVEGQGPPVAVKLVRPLGDRAGLASRLQAEAAALAGLDHPGIARLLAAGTTGDGLPWIATELVDGSAIDGWCNAEGLDSDGRLDLARQACAAVSYLHQAGVVHGDLKPSNVLVEHPGRVRLVDFGLARLLRRDDGAGENEPAQGLTPEWASPEQVRGAAPTPASDVYSLGLVVARVMERQELPAGLAPLIARATRLDPGQRFPHAGEMLAALWALGG